MLSGIAHAGTYMVDRLDDTAISACTAAPDDCTLRGAVTKANSVAGADTILFDTTVFSTAKTIALGTALDNLTDDVTITGPGASLLTVQDAESYLLIVNGGVSATFSGLTLSGLPATDGFTGILNYGKVTATNCIISSNTKVGTGIYNDATGTVTAINCLVRGNSSTGLYNNGTMTVANCTVSGNGYGIATRSDSGIPNQSGKLIVKKCTIYSNTNAGIGGNGTMEITNCTVCYNGAYGIANEGGTLTATNCTVSGNAAGIRNNSGTVTLKNNIVVGNSPNLNGSFTDGGHNITSGTARAAGLAVYDNLDDFPSLGDNGGPTQTIRLMPGSPAIDQGGSGGAATDQRGQARPFDVAGVANGSDSDGSDIGAYELGLSLNVNSPRSLPEGSAAAPGSVTFDISLSAASTQTVTVNYSTGSDTATVNDYVSKSNKLTFAPGETLKRVTITFVGDSVPEFNESFYFYLSKSHNAPIVNAYASATIINDDGLSFAIADAYHINEGNSGTTEQDFLVQLSAPSITTVTVDWAVANGTATESDYVAASGTLEFTPGQTAKFIRVQVKGDTIEEPNEYYKVNLSNPSGAAIADGLGIGSILNEDGSSLTIENAVTIDEGPAQGAPAGTSAQKFIVRLSAASTNTVTVNWATILAADSTADSSDYVTAKGSLTFAPGQTSKIITVQVIGDTTAEPDETYKVVLLHPIYAVIADGQGIGTIRNDDAAPLTFQSDEPSQ